MKTYEILNSAVLRVHRFGKVSNMRQARHILQRMSFTVRERKYSIVAGTLLFCIVLIYHSHESNTPPTIQDHRFECSLEWVNEQKVEEDNECMIRLIRERFILSPSTKPLHLKEPNKQDQSAGQLHLILNLLEDKKNGFFVESGALDGEYLSNTLYLERFLGWQGVLIEPGPENLANLLIKNRKAWIVMACLSPNRYAQKMSFKQEEALSRFQEDSTTEHVDVQCFPFHSIMLALNLTQTRIDYFSLDIEGAELDVLRTIAWDKMDIQTLSVEYERGKEPKEVLKEYVEHKGYITAYTMDNITKDYVFKKL